MQASHRRRWISALIAVPALCVALFNDWPLGLPLTWLMATAASVICVHEIASLCRLSRMPMQPLPVYASAFIVPLLIMLRPDWALPLLLVGFPLICLGYLPGRIENALAGLAAQALTVLYVLVPIGALVYLRVSAPEGAKLLTWLFVVTIFTDVGGFYAGRYLGRTRVAPQLSPNKTVEGCIGGAVLSSIASIVFFLLLAELEGNTAAFQLYQPAGQPYAYALGWGQVVLLTVALSIICQLGDAVESLIKRAVGVKDSGVNVTGHGGLLDRLDSLLFAAPFVALYHYLVHSLV